ncbi:TonB family protein [Candidatus Nitronereus thalassa]|uniref:TonB family protein n=1 Tax=Candidatus Nitronereus thalassa TaxID=3020898 RepID=A0ABU3K2Z4_9BACT|nr:TonB family protein [Candidatus Nitronereus thalassa]MDT7040739.1 TonB family protein [Candidatus Nitronereus thalassa]
MTGFFSQLSWTGSPSWQGWGSSLIVHAIAISLAFLLTANVTPPPQKESFRWEVSLVSPPPSPETPVQRVSKSSPAPINKPVIQARPIHHQQPVTRRVEQRRQQTRQSVQPTRSIVQTQRIQSVASVQHRSQVQTESPVPRTIKALAHTPSPRIAQQQEMPKPVRQSARPVAHAVPTTLRQSRNESVPRKTRQTATSAPSAKSRPVAREAFAVQAQPTRVARKQTPLHTPVIKDNRKAAPVTAQVARTTPAVEGKPAPEGFPEPVRAVTTVRQDRPKRMAAVVKQESFTKSRPVKTRDVLTAHRAIDTKSSSTVRSTPIEKRTAKEEKAVNNVTALPHHELVRNVPVSRPTAAMRKEAPATKQSPTKGLSPEVLAFLKLLRLEIEQARVYPSRARRMGLQGTTKVRFALLPNGELQSLQVAEPSGYAVLDAAALATIRKVLPFHPPDAVELEGLSIEVPIKFWLR